MRSTKYDNISSRLNIHSRGELNQSNRGGFWDIKQLGIVNKGDFDEEKFCK